MTEERIRELVPEFGCVNVDGVEQFWKDGQWLWIDNPFMSALLQTRLELETAKKDMVDGAMKFYDQVVENYRLRAALERIANHLQSPADTRFILIAIKAEISSVLTPKGANDER